jgi:hypothetical protein
MPRACRSFKLSFCLTDRFSRPDRYLGRRVWVAFALGAAIRFRRHLHPEGVGLVKLNVVMVLVRFVQENLVLARLNHRSLGRPELLLQKRLELELRLGIA